MFSSIIYEQVQYQTYIQYWQLKYCLQNICYAFPMKSTMTSPWSPLCQGWAINFALGPLSEGCL